MNKQRTIDIRYLRMARIWSENSYAIRRKVGALVVKNNMIISDGYNGTPSGFDNGCEYIIQRKTNCIYLSYGEFCENGNEYEKLCDNCGGKFDTLKTKPEVLHAESNAITKCAKYGHASNGATIYVTHSPCIECAKLIIQAGIKRVVYKNLFRSLDGINLLEKAKIKVEKGK